MNVKEIWTEKDFEIMGWHDSYIHAIYFPENDLKLVLDIDYIFNWILDDSTKLYKFWVSPCKLIFQDVLNLKIELDFKNVVGFYIQDINRVNPRILEKGKAIWNFEIETDKGYLKFESSGYKQIVEKQPILTSSQVIEREKW